MKPINPKLVRLAKLVAPLWYFLTLFRMQKEPSTQPPSSVLIFDFHLIGDIVMLTPLLGSLRSAYPNARIVLVAGPWANAILQGTNLVDKIINFSAPWVKYGQGVRGLRSCLRLVLELRKYKWSLGIEVRGDVRQILLLWIAGVERRVGFDFTGGRPLLTDVVFDDGHMAHLTEHHRRICEHLNTWEANKEYLPFLRLTKEEFLLSREITPYIGFHFGASLPLRRLPLNEVILLLTKFEFSNYRLVVFLDTGDRDFSQVLKQLPERIRAKIEIWKGDLRSLVVMLSRAIHFYCMDSGPAHIASALGTSTTVFFGPAESAYVRPIGGHVKIVSKSDVHCRPCNQVKCTNQVNQSCMVGLAAHVSAGNLIDQ